MDCWEKLKRVLISKFSNIKLRKSKGGRDGGNRAVGGGGRSSGLLNLKNDVQTCEYKDIQVMWNILNRDEMEMKQKQEHTEVITAAIAKPI
ncbi:hypothetical protein SLEP1_g47063 [Rubroshorea leprosula]|uniref:Uncharacterized protein n=1 Tax=Rubroshorea leprosula TaxID=152421 RepID=A0AAV5LP90_9ROSI|nr:hypothetical protein SLEP1_g47063 [Rubroshorea leprosula]